MNQGVTTDATTEAGLLTECLYGALLKDGQDHYPDPLFKNEQTLQAAFNSRLGLHCQRNPQSLVCSTSSLSSTGPSASSATTPTLLAGSLTAAIIGQPYWLDAELQSRAEREGHSAVLLDRYQRMGKACLSQLAGSFSVVLVDAENQSLLAAVDRLGRYPLYFTESGQGIRVASHASVLTHAAENNSDISNQGIYNYIYFHMIPAPQTVYSGVSKLQAAHLLSVVGSTIAVERYWTPNFSETPVLSMSDYGQQLKRTLGNAVQRALQDNPKTGAFLSGGLDSSTVAGILAEQGGGPVFSIGFSAEGYDEMAYARLTAKHFGLELNEYYVTPEDVVDALPRIAASYDEPFGNSSALPAYFCAKMAADYGIETLLAGDGGDELFAGNARYAKQTLFEHYLKVPDVIRQSAIEPALSRLPDSIPLISKVKSYVRQANTPLPGRLHTYNFLHQFDPAQLFSADFLQQVDLLQQARSQEAVFHAPPQASHINRMLYLDWQYTLADNDLRKVSQMCALAGVKVLYPMIDDEMIELSCQIPSHWKLKGSLFNSNSGLRHFYKKSLSGWLPQETINKRKQGFGLPFGVWMKTHKPLQDLAYDSLTNLKQHHIFKAEFLDQAIELHRSGHAAYYGELVWILMVLELWLSQRPRPAALERAA